MTIRWGRHRRQPEEESIGSLGEALNLEAMIHAGIRKGYDPVIFSQVADHQLPSPKNWLDWNINPKFCGPSNPSPFPRQIEIGLNLFEEYCPECSNSEFLVTESDGRVGVGDLWDSNLEEIQDNIVMLDHSVCPKCGRTRLDFEEDYGFHGHNELAGCAGMRSGKSAFTAGMCCPYLLVRQLELPGIPSAYYGLRPTTLHMSFVAVTATQARETLWDPFTSAVDASPWFEQYFDILDDEGSRRGLKLYDKKGTFLMFHHKRLTSAFQPADIRSRRGLTRFFGAIDEIGWFNLRTEAIRANADETYEYLKKSLGTLRAEVERLKEEGFENVPPAFMMNISSPVSQFDKIMQLVRLSERSQRIYGFHYATWEMNPKMKRKYLLKQIDDPLQLANFDRDFGATPPMTANPAFSPETVREFMERSCDMGMVIKGIPKIRESGRGEDAKKRKYIKTKIIQADAIPRVLAIDTGEMQNSFAASLMSYDPSTEEYFVDGIIVCTPDAKGRMPVHFPRMFESALLPIVQAFNVSVVYDRWNSADHVHRMEDMGVDVGRMEYPQRAFSDFSKVVGDFRLHLPAPEIDPESLVTDLRPSVLDRYPAAYAVLQLMTVRSSGKRIIKPEDPQISDDIIRTVMVGVHFINLNLDDFSKGARSKRPVQIGDQRNWGVLVSRNQGTARVSGPSKMGVLVSLGRRA